MGNSVSADEEEARRKSVGVLIPPSFVAVDSSSPDSVSTIPISCQTGLKRIEAPDIVRDLWTLNQGRQLVESYMTPGVTLSVPTATQGQILVALNPTSEEANGSFLWAEQPLSETTKVELLVPTLNSPNFHMQYKRVVDDSTFWYVRGQVNSQQKGWVEGRVKSSFHNLGMLFSLSSSIPNGNFATSSGGSIMEDVSKNLRLQAAAEYRQSLIAVQGVMDQNQLPTLKSSMASLNLNYRASDEGNTSIDCDTDDRVPPLWLTLKQVQPTGKDATEFSLNLSQILTFDRNVWNIVEERAPKIRQILGWSLQMDTTTSKTSNGESKSDTKWSVGTTWQVNRGLALKGVMTASNNSPVALKYGVIMKQWQQPRATLSLLNQLDFSTRKNSFLGFSLELEASPFTLNSPAYPRPPSPDIAKANEAAPTKVVFVPERK